MTDPRVDCWQLVLHAVVLGAHGDRLYIHHVLESLEPPGSGGLHMHCVVVPITISSRRAAAAGAGNDTLNIRWTDHVGMVVNMNEIVGPVNVEAGDVRLCAQGAFDRVGTLGAVDIFEPQLCLVFDGCSSMCHERAPWCISKQGFCARV
jgi:hypothetical protein